MEWLKGEGDEWWLEEAVVLSDGLPSIHFFVRADESDSGGFWLVEGALLDEHTCDDVFLNGVLVRNYAVACDESADALLTTARSCAEDLFSDRPDWLEPLFLAELDEIRCDKL